MKNLLSKYKLSRELSIKYIFITSRRIVRINCGITNVSMTFYQHSVYEVFENELYMLISQLQHLSDTK